MYHIITHSTNQFRGKHVHFKLPRPRVKDNIVTAQQKSELFHLIYSSEVLGIYL